MNIQIVAPPHSHLGGQIHDLLERPTSLLRITFVSAFVAPNAIVRLRERLLAHLAAGARIKFVVGIDLGGTSLEALQELLRLGCETFIFHNRNPRATFHPKTYLFESAFSATLFVGSNNLTDGGMYSNYEAAARYDFSFPGDRPEYERLVGALNSVLNPEGPTVKRLSSELIQTLLARGEVPTEEEARRARGEQRQAQSKSAASLPASPFESIPTLTAPSVSRPRPSKKSPVAQSAQPIPTVQPSAPSVAPGRLVWRKRLSKSDALDIRPGTHPKWHLVLSQAKFRDANHQLIDQETYFRDVLFKDLDWKPAGTAHKDQEHVFVPMRVRIRGTDHGIHEFEIGHKPSGVANQHNSPTFIRWGAFGETIRAKKVTKSVLPLYVNGDDTAAFLIDITD